MDAKTAILARAREAISRSQQGRPVRDIPRNYIRVGADAPGSEPVVADMVEKLEDYSAKVVLAPKDAAVLDAIDELLGAATNVVVPAGLPQAYKEAAARGGRTVREDSREEPIPTLELDQIDAVLTCSRVGISLSGTICLDGEPDQGRRAITLVPDKHVVVLEREMIMPTVPQAVDVLGQHPTRPTTWIAGGSATSDIELVRVNGVHGPRNLGVVIAH
ncbi:lactate utilization protein C [Actinomyces sp. Z5]|uniref:L-lactate dehydrogenase complex protein LldG n=1 Tax=Actinomyces ruminicola TaxID=332524 RepID=A0A1G9RJR5_9ACTO|nr:MULTISPECIES: LUD domain-containing protein [Actinomyces]MBE6482672.1 lactate utilization protein C [Actinomyces ruminicola]RAX23956.1 lactate utilization protein C [Actinomyces sp. Z5]SDM23147.1 L-lactate dehydrogenase complex protein LldG [Actinomyces ruminicola]